MTLYGVHRNRVGFFLASFRYNQMQNCSAFSDNIFCLPQDKIISQSTFLREIFCKNHMKNVWGHELWKREGASKSKWKLEGGHNISHMPSVRLPKSPPPPSLISNEQLLMSFSAVYMKTIKTVRPAKIYCLHVKIILVICGCCFIVFKVCVFCKNNHHLIV